MASTDMIVDAMAPIGNWLNSTKIAWAAPASSKAVSVPPMTFCSAVWPNITNQTIEAPVGISSVPHMNLRIV
jgi:hypothetical protein